MGNDMDDLLRVRWTGQRRRYIHKTDIDGYGLYRVNRATGVTEPVIGYDEHFETMRETPWIGMSTRILDGRPTLPDGDPNPNYDPHMDGLSRVYTWGPGEGTFTVSMTPADWVIVQAAYDGATHADGEPLEFPFRVVGPDDDGGLMATAKLWAGTDHYAPDVADMVNRRRQAEGQTAVASLNEPADGS